MITQLLNGLALGVLLLVLSSGLALVFGLRGVVNFAHGAIYMVAAYVAMTVSGWIGFWGALVVIPLIFACIGLIVDRFGLRYLSERPALDLILITFGLTLIIDDIVISVWGTQPYSLDSPPGLAGTVEFLGASYPAYRLVLIGIGLVVGIALTIWLRRSKVGLYVRASSANRTVASVVGVDIDRVSAIVVGLGLALAGLAGVLAGPYLALTPAMGVDILILTFIVVIVGGLGSVGGAMVIAIVLGLVTSISSVIVPDLAPYIPYALMIAFLLWRPLGVAGKRAA